MNQACLCKCSFAKIMNPAETKIHIKMHENTVSFKDNKNDVEWKTRGDNVM